MAEYIINSTYILIAAIHKKVKKCIRNIFYASLIDRNI